MHIEMSPDCVKMPRGSPQTRWLLRPLRNSFEMVGGGGRDTAAVCWSFATVFLSNFLRILLVGQKVTKVVLLYLYFFLLFTQRGRHLTLFSFRQA